MKTLDYHYYADGRGEQAHNEWLSRLQSDAAKALWSLGVEGGLLAQSAPEYAHETGYTSYVVTGTEHDVAGTHACEVYYADDGDWSPTGGMRVAFSASLEECRRLGREAHGEYYTLRVETLTRAAGLQLLRRLKAEHDVLLDADEGDVPANFSVFVFRLARGTFPRAIVENLERFL